MTTVSLKIFYVFSIVQSGDDIVNIRKLRLLTLESIFFGFDIPVNNTYIVFLTRVLSESSNFYSNL